MVASSYGNSLKFSELFKMTHAFIKFVRADNMARGLVSSHGSKKTENT